MKLSIRFRIMGAFLAIAAIFLVLIMLVGYTQNITLAIIGGVIAFIIAIIMGWLLSNWILQNMRGLLETMNLAGLGDLTVFADVKSNDEFGDLAAAFNVMITRLADLVGDVRNLSEKLASMSQEVAASSEEVTASVGEVTENMQSVASQAEIGSKSILEASQVLLELSSLTAISKKHSESAHLNSQMTLESAEKGKETVENAVERMARIREKTVETEELMLTLNELSKQIESITATISGLADQTNLLALNAAIEAARAGESGRGFAVVAEEVRKLAEQSTQGAQDVANLVQKVLASVEEAVEATKESRDEVENGVAIMNQAGDALTEILQAVRQTAEDVKYSVEVSDSEAASSDKVVKLIDSVATTIEKTSNHAEEVAATSEEVNASMESVAGGIQAATMMIQELSEDVGHFKLLDNNLTTKQILERAKTAHLLWKTRIDNMIKGIENVTPDEITSHTNCDLGIWYDSEDNIFKKEPEYLALEQPHKMVHQYAQEAAVAYREGNKKKAQACLKKLDRESGKVIRCLNGLIDKIGE